MTASRWPPDRRRPGRRPAGLPDERGVVPAIGKALEASLVVLFLALMTTSLFGGIVPEYRATAGDEIADRTLATAAHRVQDAVVPNATVAAARVRVDLPATIRSTNYQVRVDGRSLVLDHPDREIGARTRLALPDHVVSVSGTWYSTRRTAVVVEPASEGVRVRLVSPDPGRSGGNGGSSGSGNGGSDGSGNGGSGGGGRP